MTKKQAVPSSYIYMCQSPVLKGCKIGYHKGTPYSLYRRYQTPLTNKVFFHLFPSESPEEHEKIIHRILRPYNISNELFRIEDDDHLPYLFGYMAKMVSGCDRVKLYSREKYGYSRAKGKWTYEKTEKEEEEEYNKILEQIERTGVITTDTKDPPSNPSSPEVSIEPPVFEESSVLEDSSVLDESPITKDIATQMEQLTLETPKEELDIDMTKLNISEISESKMEVEEPEDKYIDNPFGQWAFKGQVYREKRLRPIQDRSLRKK